jgi:hypothetical protein
MDLVVGVMVINFNLCQNHRCREMARPEMLKSEPSLLNNCVQRFKAHTY